MTTREPFTVEEECALSAGVAALGKQWSKIRHHPSFGASFSPKRTPNDLKDKFRNMQRRLTRVRATERRPQNQQRATLPPASEPTVPKDSMPVAERRLICAQHARRLRLAGRRGFVCPCRLDARRRVTYDALLERASRERCQEVVLETLLEAAETADADVDLHAWIASAAKTCNIPSSAYFSPALHDAREHLVAISDTANVQDT